MSSQVEEVALSNGRPELGRPPAVIRNSLNNRRGGSDTWLRILPAWIVSCVFHVAILILFFFVAVPIWPVNAIATVDAPLDSEGRLEENAKAEDLTPTEVGIIPGEDLNYNNTRIADVSIPGPVDLTASTGMKDAAPDGALQSIPPPLGAGGKGTGGGVDDPNNPGVASVLGSAGGYYGNNAPGGLGLRGGSGATREQRAIEGGGSKESEAAVGRGLAWLAMHQDMSTENGRWTIFISMGTKKAGQRKPLPAPALMAAKRMTLPGLPWAFCRF
jgi:hypothetical protein